MNPGEKLVTFFNSFSYEKRDLIDDLYAEKIDFRDPIRTFYSREDLKSYLAAQYKHVLSCEFFAKQIITQDQSSSIEWLMRLKHRYLKFGRIIELSGCTLVTVDADSGLIVKQHDHFDTSAAVLNTVPGIDQVKNFVRSLTKTN